MGLQVKSILVFLCSIAQFYYLCKYQQRKNYANEMSSFGINT